MFYTQNVQIYIPYLPYLDDDGTLECLYMLVQMLTGLLHLGNKITKDK